MSVGIVCLSPSPGLLKFRQGELAVHALGIELDAVSGLHGREDFWIGYRKDHGHSNIHIELRDRPVLDRDLGRGWIDFRDLAIDESLLRENELRRAAEREHQA